MNWSWFPRINPVDSRVVSERPNHWRARWLTADVEAWDDGKKLLTSDGRELGPTAALFETGGGKWGAARLFDGRYDVEFPEGFIINASAPCISPDGQHSGYIMEPLTNTKRLYVDGSLIAVGPLIEPRLSNTAYAYVVQSTGEVYAARYGEPPRLQNVDTGREGWPIPIDTPDGPWLFTQSDKGALLRPLDEQDGYLRLGENFYPDCVIRNGAWWMVATDRDGRPVEWRGSLSDTRVRLTNPKPPDQPPSDDDPPKPPPEEPPVSLPTLPDALYDLLVRFEARFPVPRPSTTSGDIDEAWRAWTRRFCEQARFAFQPDKYGQKRADPGRPISTDVIAVDASPLYGWDLYVNAGTENPQRIRKGERAIDLSGQVFVPVAAVDHLGAGQPPDDPPPPPSPDLTARVVALETALGLIQAEQRAQRSAIEDIIEHGIEEMSAIDSVKQRVKKLEDERSATVDIEAILREVVARVRTEPRGLTFGSHDHALRQVR